MLVTKNTSPYYLDMKEYLHGELKKRLSKYNIHKKDLLYIDPYYLSKYLNSTENIDNILPFLRHLLQYTYRASIHEVVNEHELKEVNNHLERLETLIKKLLKAQGIEEHSHKSVKHTSPPPDNEEI